MINSYQFVLDNSELISILIYVRSAFIHAYSQILKLKNFHFQSSNYTVWHITSRYFYLILVHNRSCKLTHSLNLMSAKLAKLLKNYLLIYYAKRYCFNTFRKTALLAWCSSNFSKFQETGTLSGVLRNPKDKRKWSGFTK